MSASMGQPPLHRRAWNWLRGADVDTSRRWSPTAFINWVSIAVIVGVIAAETVFGSFRIVAAPLNFKCIEGEWFFVWQHAPAENALERGRLYAYTARNFGFGLPDGSKVGKVLAAKAGDRIDVSADGVRINGVLWGPLNTDVMRKAGIAMTSVTRSYTLQRGQLLMLGTLERAVDGRYTGPIRYDQILGPMWRLK